MKEIIEMCKCSVSLEVNKYRDYYEKIDTAIEDFNRDRVEIPEELAQRMIETGQLYELQFYPDTPVGFYRVFGTSLEEVVEKAKKCLKNN